MAVARSSGAVLSAIQDLQQRPHGVGHLHGHAAVVLRGGRGREVGLFGGGSELEREFDGGAALGADGAEAVDSDVAVGGGETAGAEGDGIPIPAAGADQDDAHAAVGGRAGRRRHGRGAGSPARSFARAEAAPREDASPFHGRSGPLACLVVVIDDASQVVDRRAVDAGDDLVGEEHPFERAQHHPIAEAADGRVQRGEKAIADAHREGRNGKGEGDGRGRPDRQEAGGHGPRAGRQRAERGAALIVGAQGDEAQEQIAHHEEAISSREDGLPTRHEGHEAEHERGQEAAARRAHPHPEGRREQGDEREGGPASAESGLRDLRPLHPREDAARRGRDERSGPLREGAEGQAGPDSHARAEGERREAASQNTVCDGDVADHDHEQRERAPERRGRQTRNEAGSSRPPAAAGARRAHNESASPRSIASTLTTRVCVPRPPPPRHRRPAWCTPPRAREYARRARDRGWLSRRSRTRGATGAGRAARAAASQSHGVFAASTHASRSRACSRKPRWRPMVRSCSSPPTTSRSINASPRDRLAITPAASEIEASSRASSRVPVSTTTPTRLKYSSWYSRTTGTRARAQLFACRCFTGSPGRYGRTPSRSIDSPVFDASATPPG